MNPLPGVETDVRFDSFMIGLPVDSMSLNKSRKCSADMLVPLCVVGSCRRRGWGQLGRQVLCAYFPDGSPIIPVAPPTNTIGLCPCF